MDKKTIILIDDEKSITDMYGEKIRQEGFNIFCANNGTDGARLISLYKPDLILLDIVMPQGDGFYVLNEIKKDNETKNIPVIVLTNLGNEKDKQEAFTLGAVEYMIKANNTPSKIIQKIKETIALNTNSKAIY